MEENETLEHEPIVDDVETLDDDDTEAGLAPEQAEEAAAPLENQEPTTEQILQKAMAQKAYEAREAQRRAKELEARLAELEAKNKPAAPVIPSEPDPYDDDFETKLRERERAIREAAIYEAEQKVLERQRYAQQQAMAQQQQEAINRAGSQFAERAAKIGISEQDMTNAVQSVVGYGLSPEIGRELLIDEDGPAIVSYLASNPLELDSVVRMSPLQAYAHIKSNVRSKAVAVRKPSKAPEPAQRLSGGGSSEGSSPLLKGASFE